MKTYRRSARPRTQPAPSAPSGPRRFQVRCTWGSGFCPRWSVLASLDELFPDQMGWLFCDTGTWPSRGPADNLCPARAR